MSLINANPSTMDDVRRSLADLNPSNWQPYDCTWTTASSAPAVGNGTLVAYYQTEGPTCRVSIELTAGSSTTFGTGEWFFTLPKPCVQGVAVAGSAWLLDASTQYVSGACRVQAGSSTITPATDAGAVVATLPFTWATGDKLTMTIQYPYRNG